MKNLLLAPVLSLFLIELHAQPVPWIFKGASAGVPTWNLSNSTPTQDELRAGIARMKSAGVNSYQIGTSWFVPDLTSNDIRPIFDRAQLSPQVQAHMWPTVTDQRLEEVIAIFRSAGIKVFLRPGIEINGAGWRGDLRPTDRAVWFANYKNFIGKYADLATRTGAELLSIGFELNSTVSEESHWNEVITEVRRRYSGPISYDAGGVLYHGSEASYTTVNLNQDWQAASVGDFLYNVDYIGVDWYPGLTNKPDPALEELQQNVERISSQYLEPLWTKYRKPILFAEIDYASANRAATNPLLYRSGTPNQSEQATAFEAVFRAFSSKPWFAGMFPASFFLGVNVDQTGTTNSVQFKYAEGVFSRWYGGSLTAIPCLFAWAEVVVPTLFRGSDSLLFYAPYYYKYYSSTGTYLAVSTADNHVYVIGPTTGMLLSKIGPVSDYLVLSGCSR